MDDRERSSRRNQAGDHFNNMQDSDRNRGSSRMESTVYDIDRGGFERPQRDEDGRGENRRDEDRWGGGRRGEGNLGSSLRGSEYGSDSGHTTGQNQYSGTSQYARGYSSDYPRREGGWQQGGSFNDSPRGRYGNEGSYGDRGSEYDGSRRTREGSRYENSGYESLSGRGNYDYRESGIEYGGRGSEDVRGGGGDWRSDASWRGGEGSRGNENRDGGMRGEGNWSGGGSMRGGESRNRQGSESNYDSGRDYNQGGRFENRDDRDRFNRENDYGRSNYMGHGDNYRRGDRRSDFGRHDLDDERRSDRSREWDENRW